MSQVRFAPSHHNRTVFSSDVNRNKASVNTCNWKMCAAAGTAIGLLGLAVGRALSGNISCPPVSYDGYCGSAVACPEISCPPVNVDCMPVACTAVPCTPGTTNECPEPTEPSLQDLSMKIYSKLSGDLSPDLENTGKEFLIAAHLCDRPELNQVDCLAATTHLSSCINDMDQLYTNLSSEYKVALAFSEAIYINTGKDEKPKIIAAYKDYCVLKGIDFVQFERKLNELSNDYKGEGVEKFLAVAKSIDQYPFVLSEAQETGESEGANNSKETTNIEKIGEPK